MSFFCVIRLRFVCACVCVRVTVVVMVIVVVVLGSSNIVFFQDEDGTLIEVYGRGLSLLTLKSTNSS